MQILTNLIAGLFYLISGSVSDYKPDRPNNTFSEDTYNAESTFTAPRGTITYLGHSKSLLTLPDGRKWVIQEQPAGDYVDIRVVDNTFRAGTILLKGDCSEKGRLPAVMDISHCQ